MSGWYELIGIKYISTISYFSNRSCPHAVQGEIIIIWFIRVKFLRIFKCKDIQTDCENADIFPQLTVS